MTEAELKEVRTYSHEDDAVFFTTTEQYGGLSNFARGFPMVVDSVKVATAEQLYQAMKFPYDADIQKAIIEASTPKDAKVMAKISEDSIRPDWHDFNYDVMEWVLQVKLVKNQDKFFNALKETGNKQIVEQSSRDDHWGAVEKNGVLRGSNVLGKLLTKIRDRIYMNGKWILPDCVMPLFVEDFKLYDYDIGAQGG